MKPQDAAPEPVGRPQYEIPLSAYVYHLQAGEGVASSLPYSIYLGVSSSGGFVGVVEVPDNEDKREEWKERGMCTVEHMLATHVMNGHKMWTVTEACQSPDWPCQEATIKDELSMIKQLRTWKLIDQSPNTNVIGRKWVFKIKHGSFNKIMKYKAQLVVQGFTQVPGIDYTNIFAPVTKLDSLCALLAVAAQNNQEIYQIDVKNAYLNRVLKEDIFME